MPSRTTDATHFNNLKNNESQHSPSKRQLFRRSYQVFLHRLGIKAVTNAMTAKGISTRPTPARVPTTKFTANVRPFQIRILLSHSSWVHVLINVSFKLRPCTWRWKPKSSHGLVLVTPISDKGPNLTEAKISNCVIPLFSGLQQELWT